MFKLLQVLLMVGVFALSACGGGSSSGGGGAAGTYTGTYSVSLFAGGSLAKDSGTFTATATSKMITITFDDGTEFTGGFSPTGTATPSRSIVGVIDGCTSGTITILIFTRTADGEISGKITGAITGKSIVCNGTNFTLNGNLKGTLNQ